ncbi:NUDIX domain-containing protein [Brachybacterium hainanense]|uniref:NUDIX domain-containing protein n=1 Tax=Brachybacterium hainanense TaxID=1541174 RepID=A0ABV6R6E9_9MICO
MAADLRSVPEPSLPRRRAVAVVVEDGMVLLIGRVKDGRRYAVLPGGGIEAGEEAETACLRELWEETGLVGRMLGPLQVPSAAPEDTVLFAVSAQGTPALGGPEKERATPTNLYRPMWLPLADLPAANLVPASSREAVTAVIAGRVGSEAGRAALRAVRRGPVRPLEDSGP